MRTRTRHGAITAPLRIGQVPISSTMAFSRIDADPDLQTVRLCANSEKKSGGIFPGKVEQRTKRAQGICLRGYIDRDQGNMQPNSQFTAEAILGFHLAVVDQTKQLYPSDFIGASDAQLSRRAAGNGTVSCLMPTRKSLTARCSIPARSNSSEYLPGTFTSSMAVTFTRSILSVPGTKTADLENP